MELTNILLSIVILILSIFYDSITNLTREIHNVDERVRSLDETVRLLNTSLLKEIHNIKETVRLLNTSLLKEIHNIKDWGVENAILAQKHTLVVNRVKDSISVEASFFALQFLNNVTKLENIALTMNYHTFNHSHHSKYYDLYFGIFSNDLGKKKLKEIDCLLEFYPDYDTTLCLISKPSQIKLIKTFLGERVLNLSNFKNNRARLGEKYGIVCNGYRETQYYRTGVVNSVNNLTFVIDIDAHKGCSGSLVFNGEGITGMMSRITFPGSLITNIQRSNEKGDIVTYPHATKLSHVIHIDSIRNHLLEISRRGVSQNHRKKIKLITQEED